VANVGDSRALLSRNLGRDFDVLTNDHKPNEPPERKRIIEAGGKVYQ
jgi:serine/threonine protein phosphatase PrpC